MDATDGALVAQLMLDPLSRTAALCEVTGLTRNAVKARLKRLADSNVLSCFAGVPNPRLFNRVGLVAVYAAPPQGTPARDKILEPSEVISYSVNHDGKIGVSLFVDPTSPEPPAMLDAIMGGPAERTFVQEGAPLTPAGTALGATQWRILEALITNPRATPRELAKTTDLTAKVVTRHRKRLFEGGHITPQVWLMSGRTSGVTFFELYAQGPAAADPTALRAAVGPSWVIDRLSDPLGVLLLGQAENTGMAIGALNRAKSVAGINHAELIFAYDYGWAPERLQQLCQNAREAERKLQQSAQTIEPSWP